MDQTARDPNTWIPPPGELRSALWPGDRSPTRKVRCRHCRQLNHVQASLAVTEPERHQCGTCHRRLFLSSNEKLTRLSPSAYEHSLDRRSLTLLRSIPGASAAVRRLLEIASDRTARLLFMAEAVLCEEDQFPELVQLLGTALHRLDIDYRPTLFLGESPHMNAMTTGVKQRVIVVQSALLDQMNDRELIAILGHELGHLQADHPLYQSVARVLIQGAATTSSTVRLLSMPIWRLLLYWSRCAELTADRAALLASRDLGACISMMMTFAGGKRPGTSSRTRIRLAPFIRQCRELVRLERNQSIDGLLSSYLSLDRTHPHLAWRVMHLLQWAEHGNYLNILSGEYPKRPASQLPQLVDPRAAVRGREAGP